MADSGSSADSGQAKRRRIDEMPSTRYHGPSIENSASARHRVAEPCPIDIDSYAMFPSVYAEAQNEPHEVTSHLYVAQHPTRPAAQPHFLPHGPYSAFAPVPVVHSTPVGNFAPYTNPPIDDTVLPYPSVTPLWSHSHGFSHVTYDQSVMTFGPTSIPSSQSRFDPVLGNLEATVLQSQRAHRTGLSSTIAGLEPTRSRSTVHIAPKPASMTTVPVVRPMSDSVGCIGRFRRRRFSSEDLGKVNKVREQGACLRCRVYKLSCDLEEQCIPCKKVEGTAKVRKGPCIRPRLDTVQSFRAGDGDNRTIIPTLPELTWAGKVVHMSIKIKWPFSPDVTNDAPMIQIDLEEFEPTGESLVEEWTPPGSGKNRTIQLPPLACRNTEAAGRSMESFLADCQHPLEKEITRSLEDPIARMTWSEVLRVRDRHDSPPLANAIRIYTAAMMNTKYLMSATADAFGVKDDSPYEPNLSCFPEPGSILPPQLTYQLQQLIAMDQSKLQDEVIRDLKRLVFITERQKHWYTVFLSMFVLLASIELMHHKQHEFLRFKSETSQQNRDNVSYVTQFMIDQWENSAENLIAHFRMAMRGHVMFSPGERDFEKNLAKANLDTRGKNFVMYMRKEMLVRKQDLLAARESRRGSGERRSMWALCELFLPDEEELQPQPQQKKKGKTKVEKSD